MRNKLIPFLSILFFASGCYIYKPYTGNQDDSKTNVDKQNSASLRDPKTGIEDGKAVRTVPAVSDSDKPDMRAEETKKVKEEEMRKMKEEELKGGNEDEAGKRKEEMTRMKEQEERKMQAGKDSKPGGITAASKETANSGNANSLKSKIQPNKYYRITVDEKRYKIQAKKWEGDILVCHKLRKPKKVLRFHQNQIDEETLEERRFSKPYSDLMTVGSYVAAGVTVLLLVL